MRSNSNNILITGPPRIGKTTLIMKILQKMKNVPQAGFCTRELRENNIRTGFELVNHWGQKSILAHIGISSPFRVGKYGVDVPGFESYIESIDFFKPGLKLIFIDEIGKMECFSPKFRVLLSDILTSEKWVLGTVALKGSGVIAEVKKRPDVRLFYMTAQNRDLLDLEIIEALRLA